MLSLLVKIVLKNGLLCGLFIVLLALLKNELFIKGVSPDLYITLIGIIFITFGFYFRSLLIKDKRNGVTEGQTGLKKHEYLNLLSRRETEVYNLLLQDHSNKEIADLLFIEMSTLKSHINAVYRKLDVKNRKELRLKFSNGLNLVVS